MTPEDDIDEAPVGATASLRERVIVLEERVRIAERERRELRFGQTKGFEQVDKDLDEIRDHIAELEARVLGRITTEADETRKVVSGVTTQVSDLDRRLWQAVLALGGAASGGTALAQWLF